MAAAHGSDAREASLWSGLSSRLNEGLPLDSTDRWPEPMRRGEFQVPMAMWNVLGKKRFIAAEHAIGPLNLSQAERRELEETWTMIQTEDLMLDRYPPESRPRPLQSMNFIPVGNGTDGAIESRIDGIDEDEEFLRKDQQGKTKARSLSDLLKHVCCLRKKESPKSLPKPKVRTFKVNQSQTPPPTPEILAQGSSATTQSIPSRRLMRHSLMAEYAESCRNTEPSPSCYVSGRFTPSEHPIYNYNPISPTSNPPISPVESLFPRQIRRPFSRMSSSASGAQCSALYGGRSGDSDGGSLNTQIYRSPEMSSGSRTVSGSSRSMPVKEFRNRAPSQRTGIHGGIQDGKNGYSHDGYDRRPHRPYHIAHSAHGTKDGQSGSTASDLFEVQPVGLRSPPSPHTSFRGPIIEKQGEDVPILCRDMLPPQIVATNGDQIPQMPRGIDGDAENNGNSPILGLPFLECELEENHSVSLQPEQEGHDISYRIPPVPETVKNPTTYAGQDINGKLEEDVASYGYKSRCSITSGV
ncbi:hypothetical protein Cpir12675_003678 [Ceratocystis pirilliformis]|uniref:Uncharacterized protein n=1 Tax=Ceratocystis pirilliformis TaxID=259994 RepID=A0ABR3Z2L4_9PEZI